MSDSVEFKIRGMDEIARKLEQEPPAIARELIQQSLKPAVEPWRQEMIARVRRGWHLFSSHLGAKGLRARGGHGEGGREREFGVIAQNIQVRVIAGATEYEGSAAVLPSRKSFWAKFLEFGTSKMPAFPFVRPAFETKKQQVLENFLEQIRQKVRSRLNAR